MSLVLLNVVFFLLDPEKLLSRLPAIVTQPTYTPTQCVQHGWWKIISISSSTVVSVLEYGIIFRLVGARVMYF
jgi:hypothetical protein